MVNWIKFLGEHCKIDILADNIVKAYNTVYDSINNKMYHDIIAYNKDSNLYIVSTIDNKDVIQDVNTYTSIRDYLNY